MLSIHQLCFSRRIDIKKRRIFCVIPFNFIHKGRIQLSITTTNAQYIKIYESSIYFYNGQVIG